MRRTERVLRLIIVAAICLLLCIVVPVGADTPGPVSMTPTLVAQTPTRTPSLPPTVPGAITISKTVSPEALIAGSKANVIIRLTGRTLAECLGLPGKPADVLLVIDNSTSAGDESPESNWTATRSLVQALLDQFSQTIYAQRDRPGQSRLGIVTTRAGVRGPEPWLQVELTDDLSKLRSEFAKVTTGGDSNIADGIGLAGEVLALTAPDRAKAILIIAHDNVPIPNAFPAVQEVSRSVPIYLLVNSKNLPPSEQITAEQATQLVGAGRFFIDPKQSDLRKLFVEMTEGDPTAAAAYVRVVDSWAPSEMVYISDISGPGGRIEGGRAVWDIPRIRADEAIDLKYTVTIGPMAEGKRVQSLLSASLVDCNGFWHSDLGLLPHEYMVPEATATSTPVPTPSVPLVTPPASSLPTARTYSPPPTPPVGISAPQTITLNLCPGQSQGYTFAFRLPPAPQKADILFAFDLSGSMSPIIQSAKSNAMRIMSDLGVIFGDVQFGVVGFTDYPLAPYGDRGDHPYTLYQVITADTGRVQAVLANLSLENGADEPEAYTRVLFEVYSDGRIGWRTGARHLVILFGDSVPHDNDLNEGIPSPQVLAGSVWNTGAPPSSLDPGRDGEGGTPDDLDFQQVLQEFSRRGYVLLAVVPGASTPLESLAASLMGAPAGDVLASYWQQWSGTTGGDAVVLEDATQLPDVIKRLMSAVATRIADLRLVADTGYEKWLRSTPPAIRDISLAGTAVETGFQGEIVVPSGVYDGVYRFTIHAVGDGVEYASWAVEVNTAGCGNPGAIRPTFPTPRCDTWLWRWVLPLFLSLLLVIPIWLLAQRLRYGEHWFSRKSAIGIRCWLPCILALLYTLVLAFLLSRLFLTWLCPVLTAKPVPPAAAGTQATTSPATSPGAKAGSSVGSQRIAELVVSAYFDSVGTPIGVDDLRPEVLAQYDTLVFSQFCTVGHLPRSTLDDIVQWVRDGGKLIIYDSDECPPADYSWLPYPFRTDNPGALGSSRGQFIIAGDDCMMTSDPKSPYYIDAIAMSAGTDIGDANVITTGDLRWCGDAEAINDRGARGYVHAYAFFGNGLIIYNGLDTDDMSRPAMNKIWRQELAVPWGPGVNAKDCLPCQRRVAVASVSVVRYWPWLIPLILLWFLCWWLCKPRKVITEIPLPQSRQRSKPPLVPLGHFTPPEPVWDPTPTLVIGLGGTGRWVLTHLKKNLKDAAGGVPNGKVRLLVVDTSHKEVIAGQEVSVRFAGVELEESEQLVLGENLRDLVRDLARDKDTSPEFAAWFPADEYVRVRRLPEDQLDVRRTTNQRRPLGRAVAFKDIRRGVEGPNGSRLWTVLVNELGRLIENDRAQIMIVASVAGGLGSAILGDVAYLCRLAAKAAGASEGAVVRVFLVTDNAFAAVTRSGHLRLNAMAALREISRFMQGMGRPYPMQYVKDSRDRVLNGYCEWSLFDHVFVLDGQRLENALVRWEPQKAMFPLVADAMMTMIDRSARKMDEHRSNLLVDASAEQLAQGEAVVSGLGCFTYHLPMLDIFRGLSLRYARDVLRWFLFGADAQAGSENLDWRQNREVPKEEGPAADARRFLLEGVGGPTSWLITIMQAQRETPMDIEGAWTPFKGAAVASDASEARGKYVDAQVTRFRENLASTYAFENEVSPAGRLMVILNGKPDSPTGIARSGKLAYALEFLRQLELLLDGVGAKIDQLNVAWPESDRVGLDVMREIALREKEITSSLRADLEKRVTFLIGEAKSGRPGESIALRPVLELAEESLAREYRYREEMRSVVTRHTFVDESFVDELYRNYFAPHLEEGLEYIFWRPDSDGHLELVVRHPEESTFTPDANGQRMFLEALVNIGEKMGEGVWRTTIQDLLDDEQAGLWRESPPDVFRAEVDRARGWAEPTVTVQIGKAQRMQTVRFLWAKESIRRASAFGNMVQRLTNSREDVIRLEATDPYAASLVTTLEVVPMPAMDCYVRLRAEYLNQHGLGEPSAGVSADLRPEPVHVYAAESNALRYEQRLPEIHEPPRLFHPLFVAALEDLTRARLFALAYALGLVRRRAGHSANDVICIMHLPSRNQDIPLTRPDLPQDPVALVVTAMQSFVLGHPERDVVQHNLSPSELAAAVNGEIAALIPSHRETLRKFLSLEPYQMDELARDNRIGTKDFLSFTRLVVRDELLRMAQQGDGGVS